MQFADRLKGAVTQVLLKSLLEDGGYRIVPLGIEEVIRELTVLSETDYKALQLPTILRKMPDFFVSDEPLKNSWLVEVKYRKRWNEQTRDLLGRDLIQQVSEWNPLYLMVFLGSPGKFGADLPSSWMGLLRLSIVNGEIWAISQDGKPYKRWSNITWKHFIRIQDIFTATGSKDKWEQQTLQKVRLLLPQLKTLDVFE